MIEYDGDWMPYATEPRMGCFILIVIVLGFWTLAGYLIYLYL